VNIVLDTNIVLDLFVFGDPATPRLREALDEGHVRWIATPVMREELRRVLHYPHLQPRLQYYGLAVDEVLARFDARAILVDVAPRAPMVCKDADDQKFIDLAYAHKGPPHSTALLSKDKAVLKLRKRLGAQGVDVAREWAALVLAQPAPAAAP
jgi:putative PIN family toxin of toxin-antitoxin system